MIKKFLLFFLCILTTCSSTKKQDTLRVGISPDYPPFAMKLNNELQGSDVEMMKAIGKKLNKKIIFKEMEFNALIPALLSRKLDLAISGISPTNERRKKVLFSTPYYAEKNCILFNTKRASFSTVNDLEDKTIAATLGTVQQGIVERYFKNTKIYNNNFQIVEELKIGRIDALLIGEAQCLKFKEKYPEFNFFMLPATYNEDSSFAIALPKDEVSLAKNINQAIDELKQTDQLNISTQ